MKVFTLISRGRALGRGLGEGRIRVRCSYPNGCAPAVASTHLRTGSTRAGTRSSEAIDQCNEQGLVLAANDGAEDPLSFSVKALAHRRIMIRQDDAHPAGSAPARCWVIGADRGIEPVCLERQRTPILRWGSETSTSWGLREIFGRLVASLDSPVANAAEKRDDGAQAPLGIFVAPPG